jgi:glycosyltransferase involved in cell wall biosynthesis
LYQHALAFVLPTTVETFGHPYAEAMASGSPLIAADTEIAREICGNAATFFPAGDVEGLVSAMRDLASRDPNDTESIKQLQTGVREKGKVETKGESDAKSRR